MTTQRELRDMWLSAHGATHAYNDGWFRYENGHWKRVHSSLVTQSVMYLVEEHGPLTAELVESVANLIKWSLNEGDVIHPVSAGAWPMVTSTATRPARVTARDATSQKLLLIGDDYENRSIHTSF